MRPSNAISAVILSAAALVAGCATTQAAEVRSPEAEKELAKLLDRKVAGQPQSCLPTFRSSDMIVIDERTILFRDGSNRYWRNDLNGPCSNLGRPGYALLTKQFGTGLCRGEIAQVIDTANGFIGGTCSLGDFVPYTGPKRS